MAIRHFEAAADTASNLHRGLIGPDNGMKRVASSDVRGILRVLLVGKSNLIVEVERGLRPGGVHIGNVRELTDALQLAAPWVIARVDRQELVDRCERADEAGDVNDSQWSDRLLQSVREGVERVWRPPVWSAECDQHSSVAPSAQYFQEVARDQTAHRVRDENQLRVAVAGRLAPSPQPAWGEAREPASGHAVVAPPVIGKLEVVEAGTNVELVNDRSEERRVGKECRSRWWPEH